MTTEEIVEKYLDLFTLVIETAGDITGISSYKEVKRILKDNKETLDNFISQGAPFNLIVTACISFIVLDIHGVEKLSECDDSEIDTYTTAIWDLYLKNPTRKFSTKYGLPTMDNLDVYFRVRRFTKRNND